jgi:hypothetical protein
MTAPKEYFVDPVSGNDITGDGSRNFPVRTLARVAKFVNGVVFPHGVTITFLQDMSPDDTPLDLSAISARGAVTIRGDK